MGAPKFGPLKKGTTPNSAAPNLYVANCGPAVGLSHNAIAAAFGGYGEVKGVYNADATRTRVIVAFVDEGSARAALEALNGRSCPDLNGRVLHIRYSTVQPTSSQVRAIDSVKVCLEAKELNIPGIYLWHDFLSTQEEEELLSAVDQMPWKKLAKRKVQHYGYEFCYDTRNIDTKCHLGQLPSFFNPVLQRISSLSDLHYAANVPLDQLTVNEYPPGVGLSPHIDTHSAFEGLIFSLSLAGPCIMEFRRYPEGGWLSKTATSTDMENEDDSSALFRRAVYLPPRSMLLMSGEGRYAWHHYIPHHKVDVVRDTMVRRGSRRVSLTLRQEREYYRCRAMRSTLEEINEDGQVSCKSLLAEHDIELYSNTDYFESERIRANASILNIVILRKESNSRMTAQMNKLEDMDQIQGNGGLLDI